MATPVLRPDTIHRIAVFRALVLGDVLCAVPALRAIRRAYPQAHVTFVGLPWGEALLSRLGCCDAFAALPGHPDLPESGPADPAAFAAFLDTMRHRRFDLAIQLHGSGRVTNPIVEAFGARTMAAFVDAGACVPAHALTTPWPHQGHEIERCLSLTDRLGLERHGLHLSFPVNDADRSAARALTGDAPYAVLHPGSQLRSRRWPPERFAAVADALAARGLSIVITGTGKEAPLAAAMRAAMQAPALDLAGATSLWQIGALVENARVVVCNDTGISHVAAALRTPSVVVACGSDVARWAPLDRSRHRVLWAAVPCRPCGHDLCPTAHECAAAIEPAAVAAAALDLCSQAHPWPARCASSRGMSTATTSTT
jgi:ADP-heptose:LPS heptosyltransferase